MKSLHILLGVSTHMVLSEESGASKSLDPSIDALLLKHPT